MIQYEIVYKERFLTTMLAFFSPFISLLTMVKFESIGYIQIYGLLNQVIIIYLKWTPRNIAKIYVRIYGCFHQFSHYCLYLML